MFTITTTYKTNSKTGKGTITAKGRGRQVTVPYDHAKSVDANHGSAAGVLGNKVMSDVEQAKVWHPSGLQRLTHTVNNTNHVFTVNV